MIIRSYISTCFAYNWMKIHRKEKEKKSRVITQHGIRGIMLTGNQYSFSIG